MKIGIIGCRGIPNQYGGFEQFAEQLSVGLVQKGHTVSVYNSHLHPYQEKEWNGVHIIHCRDWENRLGTAGQFMYDLNCINDARKRNYDVLLHLGYTSDSVWNWRWPKQTRHMVNMDGLEWKRSKYNKLTQRFLTWAESLAVKHADLLVADSIGIREYLQSTYSKEATYIPYGATVFSNPDPSLLPEFGLQPKSYYLLIARLEPENNIETVIKGHLASGCADPLLVIGSTGNKYGKYLAERYSSDKVRFPGAVYEMNTLNNLRYYSKLYFHGHSVGGTNPSLLEAMACGCRIAAHDNIFNRAVLGDDASYFNTASEITAIINQAEKNEIILTKENPFLHSLQTIYHPDSIVNSYEKLLFQCINGKKHHP